MQRSTNISPSTVQGISLKILAEWQMLVDINQQVANDLETSDLR